VNPSRIRHRTARLDLAAIRGKVRACTRSLDPLDLRGPKFGGGTLEQEPPATPPDEDYRA
jgi:hypothetical protein